MINKNTYKRLTKRDENGRIFMCVKTKSKGCTAIAEAQTKILERLALLEDKIENGTLREVPCKVGDTVYYINDYGWGQYKIIPLNVSGFKIGINNRLYVLFDFDTFAFAEDIFTTKEAAEARLKELQEKQL